MTPEQQAVIDAAKAWNMPDADDDASNRLVACVADLLRSEQPPAPIFPDPPTDHFVYQRSDNGNVCGLNWKPVGKPTTYRKLDVAYTPADEPAPERIIYELLEAIRLTQEYAGFPAIEECS